MSCKHLLILLSIFLFFSAVIAKEGIKYDFDEVEVVYAAEFFINPINVDSDNWLTQIAGGTDKPVNVIYGVVNLKNNGNIQVTEEFIKVSGDQGSERFLMNSGRWDYYEGTNKYKQIGTFFWSAKKLVDSTVVKDFTPPIKSISFYRKFDENQNIEAIALIASNDGQKAGEEFWTYDPFTTSTTSLPPITVVTTTSIPVFRTTTIKSTTSIETTSTTTVTKTTTLVETTILRIPENATTTPLTTTLLKETTTTIPETTTLLNETTNKMPIETTTVPGETTTIKEETKAEENLYEIDLETLKQVGEPTATGEIK